VAVLLDGSSVGSCLGTLEILKVLNLELFLGSTKQSETVIGYEIRSVREWYQRYFNKCLTIGGVGGRVLDVGKQDAVVTITSSCQTSSTNGEEVSVVA
jgi:hypothetical protein